MESSDAYKPDQIAKIAETVGVTKANSAFLKLITLGILAGAFIAFGAMFYTQTITGSEFGYGPTKLLGGVTFSLGLILVVVAGAELFTGNNLIVIAWADKKVTTQQLLRNWLIVYVGNFIGAAMTALLVDLSGILASNQGAVGQTAINIALAKTSLEPLQAFVRGILCNALVCLAVWLCFSARRVAGKILAIIFPISAFVALGFEHSVANMYFIPLAMMQSEIQITLFDLLANLTWVTLGNVVGGSVFVALVYWLCYLRDD
ncbi:formate/nitrite transporter family protein [Aliikangiella marina]|uniref:Formate/nitrite transporter family protein n=1 Tax=Aliikangiella marina TaxID=1712262 RepID=A0A545TJL3_9GAMM|nr:formate/nitrite transporter family protein [Aliikangiella marina]TQV77424.1 formate/nitrite transporter family protein [Aliikangiella marina]